MKILGIETSCDDTAASLIEFNEKGPNIINNVVSSQIDIHKIYGGIVPEVAGRQHADSIIPVIREAFEDNEKPDAIAVTSGPGLITSLVVGVEIAKALSYSLDIPIVATNHIEGHIYSVLLGDNTPNEIKFPAIALIVSGGHTELILMKNHGEYSLLGKTRDDASGECFDKVGKILGFQYPGGPKISKAAVQGKIDAIKLPRPMIDTDDYDFSFAGLKTAARYHIEKNPIENDEQLNDFCASFEQAIVDVLITKTIRAAKEHKVCSIILGGGVSANRFLRDSLLQSAAQKLENVEVLIPELGYTTDNAAMIAMAGYFHAIKKNFTNWKDVNADPSWELVR